MNLIYLVFLLFPVLICQAQELDLKEMERQATEAPSDEYRFIGSLICKSTNPDINPNTCNRIGDLTVGDSWDKVKSSNLGKLVKVVPIVQRGSIAMVYAIQSNETEMAYWVIENYLNKVASIQITGNFKVPNIHFSSIYLGDSQDKVQSILGKRYVIRDVPEIKGTMWDYAPFKITIEFVDGKVYSMRVEDDS